MDFNKIYHSLLTFQENTFKVIFKFKMKLFLICAIFSTFSLVFAAPSSIEKFTSTSEFYDLASEYQSSVVNLQREINSYIVQVRTAIPSVLKVSANETLINIEANADKLFEQEADARTQIFTHPNSTCILNLRDLINRITEFTGYESSNCVARYDLKLTDVINEAYKNVTNYEKDFGDVLHIVVRSFIGSNVFINQTEISERFATKYADKKLQWDEIEKDIDYFKAILSGRVKELNYGLEKCFVTLQNYINPVYSELISQIATCDEFNNTRDPYEVFFFA